MASHARVEHEEQARIGASLDERERISGNNGACDFLQQADVIISHKIQDTDLVQEMNNIDLDDKKSADLATSNFALFPRLPSEIRLQIWRHSMFQRVVTINRFSDIIEAPYPALLAVCLEAREEALKRYSILPVNGKSPIFVDFERDMVNERSLIFDVRPIPVGNWRYNEEHLATIDAIRSKAQIYTVGFDPSAECRASLRIGGNAWFLSRVQSSLPCLRELAYLFELKSSGSLGQAPSAADCMIEFNPAQFALETPETGTMARSSLEQMEWRLKAGSEIELTARMLLQEFEERRRQGKWLPEVVKLLKTVSSK